MKSTIVEEKACSSSPSVDVLFKKYPSCLGIKHGCVNGASIEYSPSLNLNL